jgi:hypothetical protein
VHEMKGRERKEMIIAKKKGGVKMRVFGEG